MVKLIKFRARFNGKTYFKGDTIAGLSKKDEAQLVYSGCAEFINTIVQNASEEDQNNEIEQPEDQIDNEDIDSKDEANDQAAQESGDIDISFDPDEVIKDGNSNESV